MVDVLFIKTSSLGDVVHNMPAVTDARRARPTARLVWVVEEAFVPLARLHPGVDEVVPVAWRRWRRALQRRSTWQEIRRFVASLRGRDYDAVIDTQGLVRTAVITRFARGRRHGYDRRSVREGLATLCYEVRHSVGRDLHAVARNRLLTGAALGYVPEGPVDYGLDRAALAPRAERPYAILLHATARAEKEWPEADWIALGRALADRDLDVVLPWGTPAEEARAKRLADALPRVRIPDRRPLDEVARLIAGATVVVGVDTGLLHLAAALGVPLVSIFVGSEPALTGPTGTGPIVTLGGDGLRCGLAEVEAAVDRVLPLRTR
ncbi:lipopolysaccharide heptosyltransferase I [Rhodoplanes roseus]|uniref:Lipopolysaccharide heptosyltransferase 1 n=1 Tax=Rhodoplanes roseus TaxID=29409 RepID=A0A327L3W6_9BRAD|nr:lipopolysaccharide heptosyltransferase I [Rhodoplanes roseus]RAI45097.1 lipopolysaccharide heptosyltransferase I [Rhodoplanes roseus]